MRPIKRKYSLTTLGCQMNLADSQRLRGILNSLGCVEVQDEHEADIILYNTCCVREHAQQRLLGRIQSLSGLKRKNKGLIIGVAGCVAQKLKEKIFNLLPMVDLVFGPNDIESLPELLKQAETRQTVGSFAELGTFCGDKADKIVLSKPFTAMVNIIRGCTNFCSYCIVPYVRGPEISRPPSELKEYITSLAAQGVKEIMVLGQNVNAYGKDLGLKNGFAELLEMIENIKGIEWVRFMTSHPRDFSKETIERIAALTKVCEQYHLPVQSGSNRILKAMRRGYTREQYLDLISLVRSKIKNVCLSTDVICGFPGETEEEFEETVDLIKKIRYESAYIYYYSPREGTDAAKMPNQLSDEAKKARLARLIDIQTKISREESQKQVGKVFTVLAEGVSARSERCLTGKTRTSRSVDFEADKALIGSFVRVKVDTARNWTLSGKLQN